MEASQKKKLEDQIKKDEYFIQKMHSMGEKFCSYPLIIDAIRDAEERIKSNKAELETPSEA
ncbi:hypothetical protein [Adhaeribacter soli]|uniref:Uncharacterized protein n=1 Tax=Adhaeribacter soli TaxID=2607655 RepID=A0A5N1IIB1_9BACT|nr:hypothetical protein [Adhaeribacter soli]KAA9325403.1 hypothetical protein F0P94_17605 [Adhaeribacter soli]